MKKNRPVNGTVPIWTLPQTLKWLKSDSPHSVCVFTHHTVRRCCPHSRCPRHSARGCGYSSRSGSGTRLPHTPWELQREKEKKKVSEDKRWGHHKSKQQKMWLEAAVPEPCLTSHFKLTDTWTNCVTTVMLGPEQRQWDKQPGLSQGGRSGAQTLLNLSTKETNRQLPPHGEEDDWIKSRTCAPVK